MSPEELGRKVWAFLGLQAGDNIVLSRDRLSQSILVSRERGSEK